MRKSHVLAALLAVSAAPAALAAQGAAVPAKPAAGARAGAKIDPKKAADVQRAAIILRAFNLAFESKTVTQPVKGALMLCLYNSKLSDISAATERALAASPGGQKPDATAIYRAAAGVCGVTFKKADGAAAGAKPLPPLKPSDGKR
ncbi:MAG: hypothetical protein P0Y56_02470 [Candidatus Andeanibacterium colombiense]|uniref:Uncharacterized protein n=1 Tax=Candidatus Andeanibacterium colombiense TaxID=3121345 RepID=A0AAJ6BNK0_9SPHN|nr:MAG: hypothetical protein P0Y56_02470 [Sphingomonadaceae bacterium]